jgi:hypothetical protein
MICSYSNIRYSPTELNAYRTIPLYLRTITYLSNSSYTAIKSSFACVTFFQQNSQPAMNVIQRGHYMAKQ